MRSVRMILIGLFICMLAIPAGMRVLPAIANGGVQNTHTFQLFVPSLSQSPNAELLAFAAAAPTVDVIVLLHPSADHPGAVGQDLARRHQGRVGFIYQHAIQGFSLTVPERALAGIAQDNRVAHVEVDQEVYLLAQQIPTGISRIFALDNENLSINGVDDLRVDVDVAVIDTGIDAGHSDLNVHRLVDCSGGGPLRTPNCKEGQGSDGNGHGTHVAGTIGAIDNNTGVVGVAPGARLWGIKVLGNNGSGYISWIVAGVDYVTANAGQIEVANMSLGCECTSAALDQAIANSVAAGVVYAVAAGNSAKDASTFSPANHPDVLTVSALADGDGEPGSHQDPTCRAGETDDTLATFSNFGPLINIAAPGVCILSTWPGGGYHTISGTSMAAPHVAGAAALLTSGGLGPTNKTGVFAIYDALTTNGNSDWVDDSGDGIKEPLLDVSNMTTFSPAFVAGNGDGGDPGDGDEPGDPTPGDITLSAAGYKVQGLQKADLSWSGANGGQVDIFRNGSKIATIANTGAYTDHINARGGGSYTYKVCEAETDTCSNEAAVNF